MKVYPKVSSPEQTTARYDVALLGAETGGSLIFRAQDVSPNQGTPLHKHLAQDETFHIIAGEFRFIVGDQEVFASAGTTLFVPRNTPHSLLNIGNAPAKLISVLTPGVHDGFVMHVPKAEKEGATGAQLSELVEKYGAEILGPKQSYSQSHRLIQ